MTITQAQADDFVRLVDSLVDWRGLGLQITPDGNTFRASAWKSGWPNYIHAHAQTPFDALRLILGAAAQKDAGLRVAKPITKPATFDIDDEIAGIPDDPDLEDIL